MMSCARARGVDDLDPYVACSPFVHINIFSRIQQNIKWPAHAPATWMTNYHLHRLRIYTELQRYRIESRSIFKYYKAMISQWRARWFMTIYHAGMRYIWIEWLCIPRQTNLLISLLHYLNRIVQSAKLTFHVRYANQVMSLHIQKLNF